MIRHIACFELVTPDADHLARFYQRALGCTFRDGCLLLGAQVIRLVPAAPDGRRYPPDSTAADLWFQHFAIVTTDINVAVAAAQDAGAVAITQGGPQRLPQRSGGVLAWKFRDPDLHPLELLQFPPGAVSPAWRGDGTALNLGIDHSAISVADVDVSIAHYRDTFGLAVASRQINQGIEQSRLDGLHEAHAEVVAMHAPDHGPPHLELLGYRSGGLPVGRPSVVAPGDVAATRIVCATDGAPPPGAVRDPDGHWTAWQ